MFTGLVQAVGRVSSVRPASTGLELVVEAPDLAAELEIGASIAVSGVCLTVTGLDERSFRVDVAAETLRLTTLGNLVEGVKVNLELPLLPTNRLGGHFVQGHVDEVGLVEVLGRERGDFVLRVKHSEAAGPLVVKKGSIAIDGVSLTVTRSALGLFEVMLIPHTLEVTTLGVLEPGDGVNLEYDILAKYVLQMSEAYRGEASDESEDLRGHE
jgi:riboflavin synthase